MPLTHPVALIDAWRWHHIFFSLSAGANSGLFLLWMTRTLKVLEAVHPLASTVAEHRGWHRLKYSFDGHAEAQRLVVTAGQSSDLEPHRQTVARKSRGNAQRRRAERRTGKRIPEDRRVGILPAADFKDGRQGIAFGWQAVQSDPTPRFL
jgi:hypothetical protein